MPAAFDLSCHHGLIVKLYLEEGYSSKTVAEMLTVQGVSVCQITLLRYLKRANLVKQRGVAGFCAKIRCAFCAEWFMRTNPRHKWCVTCLPDQKMRYLLTKFGINVPRYNAMLDQQGNSCAVCIRSFKNQKIYVDHDHQTGVVRGLLCNRCNVALGYLEVPDLLPKLQSYLLQRSNIRE